MLAIVAVVGKQWIAAEYVYNKSENFSNLAAKNSSTNMNIGQSSIINVLILVVSDCCSRLERVDSSGVWIVFMRLLCYPLLCFSNQPLARSFCQTQNWDCVEVEIVPDELDQIQAILRQWCDGDDIKRPNLIITSGGIYYIYINLYNNVCDKSMTKITK